MNSQILDFEKPIAELEQKLEEIKGHVHGKDIDFDPEVRRCRKKSMRPRRRLHRI